MWLRSDEGAQFVMGLEVLFEPASCHLSVDIVVIDTILVESSRVLIALKH